MTGTCSVTQIHSQAPEHIFQSVLFQNFNVLFSIMLLEGKKLRGLVSRSSHKYRGLFGGKKMTGNFRDQTHPPPFLPPSDLLGIEWILTDGPG